MPNYTNNHEYQLFLTGEEPWAYRTNFQALDTDVEIRDIDANRDIYDPKDGALYRATDTGTIYLGDGTSWTRADISVGAARTETEPCVNVKSYGAVGDGTTDDTAAIQAAADAAKGGTLYFPPTLSDQYRITGTINMPGYLDVEGATGTEVLHDGPVDTHAFLWENEKRIRWNGPTIRFNAADQLGLGLHGMWFAEINTLSIRNEDAYTGVVGLDLLSSEEGTTDWGCSCINVNNPAMFMNAGHAGIQTDQATDDTMSVTHLNVYGGWIHGPDYGMDLAHVNVGYIEWIVLENLNYGIQFADSVGVTVNPGETTNITNEAFFDNGGNGVMQLNRPHNVGSKSTNFNSFTRYGRREIQLAPTNDVSQNYGVRLESRYSYQDSFSLEARDSTDWQELLHYGDRIGLTVSGGTGDINVGSALDYSGNTEKNGRTESGTTANRPGTPSTGQRYFDTDLGQPIWYDGSSWIDANGNAI
jgi:hypothetical protein